ncbi:hypothetical protein Zmor_025788 [Zophobas morio]|uniref:Uncharacterized protein n=1 Tax=Zophobas morio TaxID=2755281 RepID=A0AA38HST4_9CUCU|nr:hypothetical protein Zmor_025788 [Zophobas morio]
MNNSLRSPETNPCDDLFWKSRGYPEKPRNWQQLLEAMDYQTDESDQSSSETQFSSDSDTESDSEYEEHLQNNENNKDQFWGSRGRSERACDWRARINLNH